MLNRSRFSTRLSLAALFTLLLGATLGCAEPDPSTIRFGLATPPVTFDPRFATDATSYRIGRLIYQSLVDFDDAQHPVPALATWEQVSPVHYRFRLNPAQRFHDGTAVTSADVVATYRSVLDPDTVSPHRGSLVNIRDVHATAPLVVEFELTAPNPLFPGLLVIGIMPATLLAQTAGAVAAPIGSGPFAIAAPPSDSRVRLRRRTDGQLVEFIAVRDATVRALKLVHGELDLIQGSMTPELVGWLDRREHIEALHRPGTTFTYLGFNLDDPATGKLKLRQAVAHAVDREALIKHMFGARARPAQAIFPPTHWAGNGDLNPIAYDPDTARQLIGELGYSVEHPLPLVYKTSSDHFRLRVATTIQDQLARVGIAIEVSSYDWGTFYADIKNGRFQMYSLSWVGLKQPDIFRYAFHSASVPPAGANRGRYAGADVDGLIEAAEASTDLVERAGVYAQIQARLLEDLPYVPLWYEDNILIKRDSIENYDTGLDGYYDELVNVQRVITHE
jgi:peptide/nickel transport system substrate-binding protein